MVSAFALVRNLESRSSTLLFQDFELWQIRGGRALGEARLIFPGASVDDWVYQRDYTDIPASDNPAPSGFGSIPNDVEDALLLLRLFKAGDLAFAKVALRDVDGKVYTQYPYRAISEMVPFSSFPYSLEAGECAEWNAFAHALVSFPGWRSAWFVVARRFFLYGGGKEFNPHFDDVDRIVDYMIALEATLVPEHDFVGRRLRERASRIIGNDEGIAALLRDFYGVRSTIAHGSAISDKQRRLTSTRREEIESAVRRILTSALSVLPEGDAERCQALAALYDVSDEVRVNKIVEDFRAIRTAANRADALRLLSEEEDLKED